MAKLLTSIVIFSLLYCSLAQNPSYLTIIGQCRDFTPQTNPDFEHNPGGDDRGIFLSNIGSDGKPVYAGGYHPTVTSATTVYQWYRDTAGVSMGPYPIPINLTLTSNGYDFDNQLWFPLDNMGFGNYAYGHNYGFTCEFNTQFTYRQGAGQVFTFAGDDDVFVFINGKLAIDLGGIHTPETGSVTLDQIANSFGLVNLGTYRLDVFQNERHTTGSTFHMTTDLVLAPAPPASVCGNGIVEGSEQCDGGACCTTTCTFQSSSTVCRASAGPCDIAETCTGSSSSCPADSFQSSSTVCRASTGPCDITETCSGSSASCPPQTFQPSSVVCRASVGPCDPQETCTGSTATCPADVNGSFETACPGLALLDTAFTYYDVIAFGDFSANTGDIEQRLAVGGNFNVGNGWSVGATISNADGSVDNSLVIGGNGYFGSGAVEQESVFVGGTFSEGNPNNGVAALIDGTCPTSSPNCLASNFAAAQSCYAGYQNNLAANADNTVHTVQWSGLYITCNDPNAKTYYLTLTPSEMSQYTWISVDSGCNSAAKWVIQIGGTGDVSFNGGSFPLPANQVLYNVLGSGRNINVGPTQVEGSILAPYNNVNQPNGVIIGKVIANNIVSLQINEYQCYFN